MITIVLIATVLVVMAGFARVIIIFELYQTAATLSRPRPRLCLCWECGTLALQAETSRCQSGFLADSGEKDKTAAASWEPSLLGRSVPPAPDWDFPFNCLGTSTVVVEFMSPNNHIPTGRGRTCRWAGVPL